MKLIIDRTKWLRGEGDIKSSLLRPEDNKMCCLGFFALQRGVPECKVRGRANPNANDDLIRALPELIIPKTDRDLNGTCLQLITDNDQIRLEEPERERRITVGFARIGVEVEFIN